MFDSELAHTVFGTKELDFKLDKIAESSEKLEKRLGIPVKYIKQVHGTNILEVNSIEQQTSDVEADAIVTTLSRVAIGVKTADCVPLLIDAGAVIAAVHLGRKGICAGLLQKVIQLLSTKYQVDIATTKFYLGPSLEFDNHTTFPVDAEVIPDQYKYFFPFGAHYLNNITIVDNFLQKHKLPFSWLATQQSIKLDCISYLIDLLKKNNAQERNIFAKRIDTFEDQNYHSYRRDFPNHGLNFSYIYKE